VELQKLADGLGLTVRVCHFPSGTSKRNKIEHRLFRHIALNWRGRPLTSLELIARPIGATTATGLAVKADVDRGKYPTELTVSDAELAAVRRIPDAFRNGTPASTAAATISRADYGLARHTTASGTPASVRRSASFAHSCGLGEPGPVGVHHRVAVGQGGDHIGPYLAGRAVSCHAPVARNAWRVRTGGLSIPLAMFSALRRSPPRSNPWTNTRAWEAFCSRPKSGA